MAYVSFILRSVEGGYSFWCPGCKQAHAIPTKPMGAEGTAWEFDGNIDAPTFRPSILVTTGHYVPFFEQRVPSGECACNWSDRYPDAEPWPWPCSICHSYVTAGQIQFLGDCTHELAGQTIALTWWPIL